MKKETKKAVLVVFSRVIPIVIMITLAFLYFRYHSYITIESITKASPKRVALAVLFILSLYALKSLSVFFPILILMAAGGYIFGVVRGIIINIIGTVVAMLIPYIIGRVGSYADNGKIFEKYPKLNDFVQQNKSSPFITSLFARTLFFLPCDILSLYCGSIKMNVWMYVYGGIIGFLPSLIATTIAGESITTPGSPEFIIAMSMNIIISIVTIIIYGVYIKKKKAGDR